MLYGGQESKSDSPDSHCLGISSVILLGTRTVLWQENAQVLHCAVVRLWVQRGTRETTLSWLRKILVFPRMILPFLFLFSYKNCFRGVVSVPFFLQFSLVFLCLSSFLPISHFSVTTCHSSLPQSCTWLSPRMVFTKQGSDLTNIGTSLPLPLVQAEALMSELE